MKQLDEVMLLLIADDHRFGPSGWIVLLRANGPITANATSAAISC